MNRSKVLCIDDDAITLAALVDSLSDTYQVSVCSDVTEVLNVALYVKPDLILLDMMMPDVSGTEILELLKSFGTTRDIPVVAYTGNASLLDYDALIKLGIRGLIEKPASTDELKRLIGEVIDAPHVK